MSEPDDTQAFLESLPEIEGGEGFTFACGPEVDCFNACCADLTLLLSPYDVLALRRGLGISSEALFERYAVQCADPDTGFPFGQLRMLDDDNGRCPFVGPKGCSVYRDRPGACRTYPLGRAASLDDDNRVVERFVVVREEHCHGFGRGANNQSAAQYLDGQAVAAHNEFNDRTMALMTKLARSGRSLAGAMQQRFSVALYQLDRFPALIEALGLFEQLAVDEDRRAQILDDEEERLRFAFDWLDGLVDSH